MSMVRARYNKFTTPSSVFSVLGYPQKNNQSQHAKSKKIKTATSKQMQ
jgi:hypothetical protein